MSNHTLLLLSAALGVGLLTVDVAHADLVGTTVGPVDRSCVHEIPRGATVDAEGNVSLNGASIAQYGPCMAADTPNLSLPSNGGSRGAGGAGVSEWYEYSWVNAAVIHGLQQFDFAYFKWIVPANGPSDGTVIYLFPSLQNVSGNITNCPFGSGCTGTVFSIIQPILQWGYNNYNGGHYWQIEAMEVWGTNVLFSNPCINSQPGDAIYGEIEQTQTNPDLWYIWIYDSTNGCGTSDYFQPGSSWPKYNTFQGGVLEGYGNAAESVSIPSCSDLPTTDATFFQAVSVDQAGPSWDSYNPVTNSLSYQVFDNPFGFSPSCGWAAGASDNAFGSGESGTLLTW